MPTTMTPPPLIRQSELLNQPVRDRHTGEEFGRVELLWMYPPAHRVLGFVSKMGLLGNRKLAFKLSQLVSLDSNGVLTQSSPQTTDVEHVQKLESLIQLEVWSKADELLGQITDCVFDPQTGEIAYYLFVSKGWHRIAGDIYKLVPRYIVALRQNRVIIANRVVNKPEVYREGLTQKLADVGDLIIESYTGAQHEWRSLTRKTLRLTEQMKAQFQDITARTHDSTQSLSEEAKHKADSVRGTVRSEAQVWVERVKDTRQTLAEEWRDRSQTLGQQVEETFQTLNVTAEEIFESLGDRDGGAEQAGSNAVAEAMDDDWMDDDGDWLDDEDNWVDQGDEDWPPVSPTATMPSGSPPPDDTPMPMEQPADPPPEPSSQAVTPPFMDDNEDFWLDDPPAPDPVAEAPPETIPPGPPPPSPHPLPTEDDDEPWI